MTADAARAILDARFVTQWPVLLPDYDYFVDGGVEPDFTSQSKPFGFLSIGVPDSKQIALSGGAPPKRYFGVVTIGLFAKKGSGSKHLFAMADAVDTMFASQVLDGVTLTEVGANKRTQAIGWQSVALTVVYSFDSI